MALRTGMKKTPESESSAGNPSACALPSHVAIDLSKTKVRKSEEEWRQLLTPLQYRMTREQGTEPPFRNEYWDNHADGVYFSSCSETPLFDSRDKFDSGTGWPSFTKPIDPALVGETTDTSHGIRRTEVHSNVDGAHLGHRNLLCLGIAPALELELALLQRTVGQHHAQRNTDEFPVREHGARALATVVQHHVDAGGSQFVMQRIGSGLHIG